MLTTNIDYFINCLSNIPVHQDICYLTKTKNILLPKNKYNNLYNLLSKNIFLDSSCAYIITKNGATKILNFIENNKILCTVHELLTNIHNKTPFITYITSIPLFSSFTLV